jgi:hypothetical protein
MPATPDAVRVDGARDVCLFVDAHGLMSDAVLLDRYRWFLHTSAVDSLTKAEQRDRARLRYVSEPSGDVDSASMIQHVQRIHGLDVHDVPVRFYALSVLSRAIATVEDWHAQNPRAPVQTIVLFAKSAEAEALVGAAMECVTELPCNVSIESVDTCRRVQVCVTARQLRDVPTSTYTQIDVDPLTRAVRASLGWLTQPDAVALVAGDPHNVFQYALFWGCDTRAQRMLTVRVYDGVSVKFVPVLTPVHLDVAMQALRQIGVDTQFSVWLIMRAHALASFASCASVTCCCGRVRDFPGFLEMARACALHPKTLDLMASGDYRTALQLWADCAANHRSVFDRKHSTMLSFDFHVSGFHDNNNNINNNNAHKNTQQKLSLQTAVDRICAALLC